MLSIVTSVSVCLSAHISQEPRVQTSPNFLCRVHARCGRGSVLLTQRRNKLFVLPVLGLMLCFPIMGSMAARHYRSSIATVYYTF